MPRVSPNPELNIEEVTTAPVTTPTVDEVADAIRRDSAQAADYLADTEVPFGGE